MEEKKNNSWVWWVIALLALGYWFLDGNSSNNDYIIEPGPTQSNEIQWTVAIKFIGQHKTVCGKVVGMGDDMSEYGSGAIWLDIGNSYPNPNRFTVLFWPEHQKAFGHAPGINMLVGKNICITGLIEIYEGVPQIEVENNTPINVKSDYEW